MLKTYACFPENSKGRIYKESASRYNNEFERDRSRIIFSNAFKRLQYKTQVFVNHKGDHYRNRMSHSIEVSSIARLLSKILGVCDELSEAIAFAHDMGHPPFGHSGEEALNECMKDNGGFSHNAYVFKILTNLEIKNQKYKGLNLTWEVVEGIVKHNGPILKSDEFSYIFACNDEYQLDLHKFSSAESQIATLSDDIAYICHDFEDSLRANLLQYKDLEEIPLINKFIYDIKKNHHYNDEDKLIYEVSKRLKCYFIDSLLYQTTENITKYNIKTEEDIRNLRTQLVQFTDNATQELKLIKDFFAKKVYKHSKVLSMTLQGKRIIKDLFGLYNSNIDLLPPDWRNLIESNNSSKVSVVADYIAGMTDRFAIDQYKSFFNINLMNGNL